jgi:dihydropteroate synthase
MAERRAGVLRLGERAFGAEELLVMGIVPAGSMERVDAAVAEGADLVEIGDPAGSFVAAVRKAYPELVIGVRAGRPEVAREAGAAGADLLSGSQAWVSEVAASFGTGVAGPLGGAARAVAAGVAADRVMVERVMVEGGQGLAEAVGSGWPVLASVPDREEAGRLAATAVAAWLGARVFRVHRVLATRRVLRMVSAIRGDIPPACAVRGLG